MQYRKHRCWPHQTQQQQSVSRHNKQRFNVIWDAPEVVAHAPQQRGPVRNNGVQVVPCGEATELALLPAAALQRERAQKRQQGSRKRCNSE
jgi:hypothetical protein